MLFIDFFVLTITYLSTNDKMSDFVTTVRESPCNKKILSAALNPMAALNLDRLLSVRLRYEHSVIRMGIGDSTRP